MKINFFKNCFYIKKWDLFFHITNLISWYKIKSIFFYLKKYGIQSHDASDKLLDIINLTIKKNESFYTNI